MSVLTMDKVSVIIPAYNEEENIPLLLEKIKNAFKTNNIPGEVILVNDGSTDNTKIISEEASKKYDFLKVINHRKNLGLTEAIITGLKNAGGDIILFLPADLESDPEEDISKILKPIINEGYDIVSGWRKNRKGSKIFASKIFNFMCRKLFNVNYHDINWIKAFRKNVVEDIHLRSNWHRYLLILVAHKGYNIKEVEVNWFPRKHGKSKYGVTRLLVGFLDLLAVKFHLSFSKKPLLIFGSVGGLLLTTGFLLGLYLFYTWLFTPINSSPLLFLALLFILSGVLLFTIGFLGELLLSTADEIKREITKLK